jgi:hypothetical protein
MLWWGSKNITYWVIWEYYKKEKVSYALFSNLWKKLQLTWLKEDGDLFQAIPFSNHPKFHGRHIESHSAGIARNSFILMSCSKVMFIVIHPFLEDK